MIFYFLLLFVPLSLYLKYMTNVSPLWIFGTAIIGIIPLADFVRKATEQLAIKAGPAIGGLLNVTFGNTAEVILALFVLTAGKTDVVKGQITGSIIGNSLLGFGLAIIIGTWDRDKLTFKRERAGRISSLLILSVIALLLPAIFDYTERGIYAAPNVGALDERLSLGVSIVLILLYIGNLFYTLFTHRDEFAINGQEQQAKWSWWVSVGVLTAATVFIALESQIISAGLESTASKLGLSTFFLGVVVLAIIGNAAEYVASIFYARKDDMDMVVNITVGSTIQVALLMAPLLVLISYFIGSPMNLVFVNPLELIAVFGVAFGVNAIAEDGEVTWFEGLLLIGVYAILALAFFYATPPSS
jgi:Ca2+:H+ antiporter